MIMFKRILLLTLTLLMLLPLLCACVEETPADPNEGKLVLADDGVSEYRIVLPKKATEVQLAAASELQRYFYSVTGAKLAIESDKTEPHTHEILIGDTNRPEGEKEIARDFLGEEGFIIRNVGNNLYITGKEDRGTLYGVYAFIEEYLGVRYWGENEESIPRVNTLVIEPFERDNRQTPGFEFRLQSHQTAASYNEKMHLNAAWSGDTQPIAGGIEYTGPWYVHTFGTLLGWSSSHSYCRQPCLSDNKVFDKMFAAACTYIEANPDAKVISISQNDSTLAKSGECECDACKANVQKYGSSGAVLNFVNRMAMTLKSKYPDIYVETLAYYYTQEPPKGGVTAAENVIVRFCNAGGCMMHALNEEDPKSELFYPKNNNTAFQNLQGWSEAAENLYIWDYNIDFGSSLSFIPNFKRLYDNITTYYEYGVDGIYMQGMRDGGEFDRLRGYLTSKLLWNPKMSYEEYQAHMTEFLDGYFGKAGKDVAAYIDYVTELCQDTHPAMYHDISRFYPMEMTEEGKADLTVLNDLKKFYNDAIKHADSYVEERRVKKAMMTVPYYETLLCAMETAETGAKTNRLVKLNQALREDMELIGLKNLKEGLTIPKLPNYKNTALYWGWDGTLIYNDETAKAHEEAKKKAEEEAKKEAENKDEDEPIDVTKGQEEAEQNA